MTRMLARPEAPAPRRSRSGVRPRIVVLAALTIAALAPASARATPLALDSDSDVAAFAERLRAYGGASRVRWVVAARTRADAQAKIAEIASRLSPADRYLAARLTGQALDDAPVSADAPAFRAWISPQFGSTSGAPACSWQVWVTDPAFPSPEADAVTVPLAPNDRMPVGPSATFRVGHSGLLQSRLYAFDETKPGAIRDLATAPDVNVPVATEGGETIVLAMARETAPFLESVKTALAASEGQRKELGPQFALRDKLLGGGRGIGANIQAIPQTMIAAKTPDVVAAADPAKPSAVGAGPLMETCVYALTPAR